MFFPVSGDPNYSSVVLHIPMTGENDSITFTDYSVSPKTITRYGDTKISTAKSKWGQGSGYFDGTGDYLEVSDLAFGTGDFTIEGWLYVPAFSKGITFFDCQDTSTDASGFRIYIAPPSYRCLGFTDYTGTLEGPTSIAPATWNYIAITRKSSTLYGFLNGVKQIQSTKSKDYSRTSWRIGIGQPSTTTNAVYLQDIRITLGVARYIANFALPDGPLPSRFYELPVYTAHTNRSFYQVACLGL